MTLLSLPKSLRRASLAISFFFNGTGATGIYTVRNTLSLHDALPIYLFVRLGERLEVFPRRPILFDGRQDVRGDPPLELPLRVALVIEDVRDPRQAGFRHAAGGDEPAYSLPVHFR